MVAGIAFCSTFEEWGLALTMTTRTGSIGAGGRAKSDRLPERTLIALSNMGKMLKLKPGDTLLPMVGDTPIVLLVVKGLLRVERGDEQATAEPTFFRDEDWISPRVVPSDPRSRYRITAAEPSQVLAFTESTFRNIEVPLQHFIMRRVNDTYVARLRGLEDEMSGVAAVSDHLTGYILKARTAHTAGYETSELILNLLRNLPRLPAYTTQLVLMLQQDNVPQRELTRLLKEDPSLVSEILKTVNSSYYGLQKKISDLNYAVLYLGFHQIHQLLVSSGLRKIMPNTGGFQELHQHSVIISHLAHEICQFHARQKASILGTIALLHDIGKSVILLLRSQNPKWAFFIDMLDTSKIGAMLLKEWTIPSVVYECIELQDMLEFTPPNRVATVHRENIAILHAAHTAGQALQGDAAALTSPFLEDIRETLQLPGDSFDDFLISFLLKELKGKLHTLPQHVKDIVQSCRLRQ
jgi:HD-like signal output (HDOD) protein